MNRILLAYAPENAALAESIDHQLSRVGIPFEHISGALAATLESTGEPVVLIVTDNLLKNQACMTGLPAAVETLAAQNLLLAVTADGQGADGRPVQTQLDRMANALHYMSHWQNAWLALSERYQHAQGTEKAAVEIELDAVRAIANQVGDFIGALRNVGYRTWPQFEANEFEAFFQRFGLQDWHGQYRRLVAQTLENQSIADSGHLPETPLSSGVLAPEPIHETELPPPPPPAVETDFEWNDAPAQATDTPLEPTTTEEVASATIESAPPPPANDIEQAVRDAWFWLEKGHLERGIELLQVVAEQYPENTHLQAEYQSALTKYSTPTEEAEPSTEPPSTAHHQPNNEAKSYDLMGDMAAEKGDYLFAKYCWDRVAELEPNFPGLYRKLGLMTSEHLRDYRETAAIYLHKALEINPKDQEVRHALAQLEDRPTTTLSVPPTPETTPDPPPQPITGGILADAPPAPAPEAPPRAPHNTQPTALITGSTSGIGRATAETFARHGYRLIITGRRMERLVELKKYLEAAFSTEILALPFDVRYPGAVQAALGSLPESFQNIDVLINNAGLAKGLAPIHEGSLEHWETMIDTNIKGLLYVTRVISPGMVRRRQGHIINICSSAGKEAYPNGNVYCATKFAVDALTKSMRFDLHAHNIRVGQVSPGHVEETEFALNRFDGDTERAKIYTDFQPLTSSDIADTIYFMVSRPTHVNIQDIHLFGTQQASSTVIDRSGR
jgi:NADP-dependent 3-hydroxy acid dehydrogenase YdfG